MPIDRQTCVKCGQVYAERHMSGPNFSINGVRSRSDSKMCLQCGGPVIWMSAREEEEIAVLRMSLRITLWDKIKMAIGIGVLLLIGMTVLARYLGWSKVFQVAH